MKVLIIIICVLVVINLFLIFIIKNLCEEHAKTNVRLITAEQKAKKIENTLNAYTKGKQQDEELRQKAHSGSDDSFDASLQLMQKLTDKGRKRNS